MENEQGAILKSAPAALHPLHTAYMVECMEREPGGYAVHRYRRTGRSTAIALRTIANAIASPGEEIPIEDHHGTRQADKFLADLITVTIRLLSLQKLCVRRRRGSRDLCLVFGGSECR